MRLDHLLSRENGSEQEFGLHPRSSVRAKETERGRKKRAVQIPQRSSGGNEAVKGARKSLKDLTSSGYTGSLQLLYRFEGSEKSRDKKILQTHLENCTGKKSRKDEKSFQ